MDLNVTYVGLDLHKQTTAVAVLRPDGAGADERTIAMTPEAYRTLVRSVGAMGTVYCYEAGCGVSTPIGCSPRMVPAAM